MWFKKISNYNNFTYLICGRGPNLTINPKQIITIIMFIRILNNDNSFTFKIIMIYNTIDYY